jgi:hypothetical protein
VQAVWTSLPVCTLAQAGQAGNESSPACQASKSGHARPQKVNKPRDKRNEFFRQVRVFSKNVKIRLNNVELNSTSNGSFKIILKNFVAISNE